MTDIKSVLILNFRPSQGLVELQVNNRECFKTTAFNLAIDNGNLTGFIIPCNGGKMSVYGDTITETIKQVTTRLPKIVDKSGDVSEFIHNLVKAFKVSHFQVNVNANMDYSQAKPYSVSGLVQIMDTFKRFDFHVGKVA